MSGTVAAIDIVAAHHDARELLRDEVHLVRALGATEHPKRTRAVLSDGLAEAAGGEIERLAPFDGAQLAGVADHWLSQPGISPRSGLVFHRSQPFVRETGRVR